MTTKARKKRPEQERKGAERPTNNFVFVIYISNRKTARSILAITNLEEICQKYLGNECQIKIIDISKNPSLAVANQIFATPTLVKTFPLPMKRMIGDLSDTNCFLKMLHSGSIASA